MPLTHKIYFHINQMANEIILHLGWLIHMSLGLHVMLQLKSDPWKQPTCNENKRLESSGFCTIYIFSSHLVWCASMFYRLWSTVTAVSITNVFNPRKPSCNNILMSQPELCMPLNLMSVVPPVHLNFYHL